MTVGNGTDALRRGVQVMSAGTIEMVFQKWTNATTFSAAYSANVVGLRTYNTTPLFLRISDDGTSRKS
jgi:hypothetical protein